MRLKFAIVAVVLLVTLSGCVTTFESGPAEVNQDILDKHSYNETEQDDISLNQNISISEINFTKNISFSSWLTEYEKETTETTLFSENYTPIKYTTISTPSINIEGRELNPIGASNKSSVDIFRGLSNSSETNDTENSENDTGNVTGGFEIHDKVNEFNRTHIPTDSNITIFKYNATFYDDSIDAQFEGYVYTSTVRIDETYIVMLGGFPKMFEEEDEMIELIQNTDERISESEDGN